MRWTCPGCGDEMPVEFSYSHEVICRAMSTLEADLVESFLRLALEDYAD